MSYQTASKFIKALGYVGLKAQDGMETLELTIFNNHTPQDAKEIFELMQNEVKFITVDGYFGEKNVDEDDFVKEWVDHASQLMRISYEMDWMEKCSQIKIDVGDVAGKEFKRLWKEKPQVSTYHK